MLTPTAKRASQACHNPPPPRTGPTRGETRRRATKKIRYNISEVSGAVKRRVVAGNICRCRPSCNPRAAARHRRFVDNPRAQRASSGVAPDGVPTGPPQCVWYTIQSAYAKSSAFVSLSVGVTWPLGCRR